MLVFGDAAIEIDPHARADAIGREAAGLAAWRGAQGLHWKLGELFLDAAELAQGLIDFEFERDGLDADSPVGTAAMALVLATARALHASWQGRSPDTAPIEAGARALSTLTLPDKVNCRRPEGYSFYALYPEAYLEAASALAGTPVHAIGIRSIGLGLAALIAAACDGAMPISVRPVGHPFQRELRLSPALQRRLLEGAPDTVYAIADEGPGLSGSSFSAVLDLLAHHNVRETEVHVFPSHSGPPGAEVSAPNLARWHRLQRHVVDFDSLFLHTPDPARRLDHWFADLVGPPVAPLLDLSGGGWRQFLNSDGEWPPAHVQQERRKFLLTTAKGRFLLKFAGLGRPGRDACSRGQALHAAGFVPEVLAFRHGFTLERWEAAGPADFAVISRDALVSRLAAYLRFRAEHFATPDGPGATPAELAAMLCHNGVEALGPAARRTLERSSALTATMAPRRIATDNRLHAWEWLLSPDGQLLKTDAVDHCAAHDLIGCQDVAWDIAGAAVELDLTPDERQDLAARVGHGTDWPVAAATLDFLEPCYLAFQLGYYTMAAAALAGVPEEQLRLETRARLYRERLAGTLAARL